MLLRGNEEFALEIIAVGDEGYLKDICIIPKSKYNFISTGKLALDGIRHYLYMTEH
jgi:hypothetical protein